jgi:hypothetical protein
MAKQKRFEINPILFHSLKKSTPRLSSLRIGACPRPERSTGLGPKGRPGCPDGSNETGGFLKGEAGVEFKKPHLPQGEKLL